MSIDLDVYSYSGSVSQLVEIASRDTQEKSHPRLSSKSETRSEMHRKARQRVFGLDGNDHFST